MREIVRSDRGYIRIHCPSISPPVALLFAPICGLQSASAAAAASFACGCCCRCAAMGMFTACSSKPKKRPATPSTTGGFSSGSGGGGGQWKHTGGIGFEGGKLVIAGLPEQTKKLFKEASRQKRRETGKGLTKRDVKHILKTYGAELRNPDALFAKAMIAAPAPAPDAPPAAAPPPVPSFDSLSALPPVPPFNPSGPPPVPVFDPSLLPTSTTAAAGQPSTSGLPPAPAAAAGPSAEELERMERKIEQRVEAYEKEKEAEIRALREAYEKLDGMYKDLAATNEALEAELAVCTVRIPAASAALARSLAHSLMITLSYKHAHTHTE